MDFKNLFFSADGRIGRQDFWVGFLILLGANVVLNMIPLIGQILSLVLCWCWICLYSKRLHDMGKSGWLVAVPLVIAVVAGVVAGISGAMAVFSAATAVDGTDPTAAMGFLAGMGFAALVVGAAVLINLAFLLWVGLSGGQPGENRFGPVPVKAAPAAA